MKKKWMSGALALLLAGTTVASMVPPAYGYLGLGPNWF